MEVLAGIWMLLPIWGRGAVLFLILLFILKPIILKVVPKVLKGLFFLIEKISYLFFTVIITLLGFLVSSLLKKGQKNFQLIGKLENGMQHSIRNLKAYPSKLNFKTGKGTKSYMYYKWSSWLAAAVLAFTMFYWPQAALSQKWDRMDSWMIEGKMKQSRIHHTVAFENLKSNWVKKDQEIRTASAEKQPVQMQLKKNESGGSVRKEPVEHLSTQNVITQIGPGEEILFLQEEQELGGILWYKVQLANEQIGWISSNLLEPITQ